MLRGGTRGLLCPEWNAMQVSCPHYFSYIHTIHVLQVGGEVLQALVPFFDLANHDARQGGLARHCLRALDGVHSNGSSRMSDEHTSAEKDSAGWQTLDMLGMRPARTTRHDDHGPDSSPSISNSSRDMQHSSCEFFISYGEKGNRALMEQYGFAVQGNPYDRLEDWLPLWGKRSGRFSMHASSRQCVGRDSIEAAAARLLGGNVLGGTAAAAARLLGGKQNMRPPHDGYGERVPPGTSTEAGRRKHPGQGLQSHEASSSSAEACWLHASRVQAAVAGILKVAGCR